MCNDVNSKELFGIGTVQNKLYWNFVWPGQFLLNNLNAPLKYENIRILLVLLEYLITLILTFLLS